MLHTQYLKLLLGQGKTIAYASPKEEAFTMVSGTDVLDSKAMELHHI